MVVGRPPLLSFYLLVPRPLHLGVSGTMLTPTLHLALPAPETQSATEVALVEVLRRSWPTLHALASRMLSDPGDAEDALQNAWIRVWRARDRVVVHPSAFVRTVVVRECLRQLRWRGVKRWLSLDQDLPGREDPEHALIVAEEHRALRQRLDQLPARQRLIVGLRLDEGWSIAEIAEASGVGTETVKTHLSRGLARLREGV